jgi:hypothetical protein
VKNDGYDNEDSDYILYVNDILGSEEAGHKCVFSVQTQGLPANTSVAGTATSFWTSSAKVLSDRS